MSKRSSARSEFEVYLITCGEGIDPSVACEARLPGSKFWDIDSDSTLVVGGARSGDGVSLAALSICFPLVEKVLLGSRAPG